MEVAIIQLYTSVHKEKLTNTYTYGYINIYTDMKNKYMYIFTFVDTCL